MKKSRILWLLLGASAGQFIINGIIKGNIWIPLILSAVVLISLCITPNKILEEKI